MKPVSVLCTKFTSGNFIIRCRAVHAVAMLYQGGMDLGVDDVSLVEYSIQECQKYVNNDLGRHASAPMVVDCFLLLIQSLLQYSPHPFTPVTRRSPWHFILTLLRFPQIPSEAHFTSRKIHPSLHNRRKTNLRNRRVHRHVAERRQLVPDHVPRPQHHLAVFAVVPQQPRATEQAARSNFGGSFEEGGA